MQLFNQRENRETFFRRVHVFVLPYHKDALRIARAYNAAKEAFRGVKRKRGERYFEHCRMVALVLIDLLGVHDPDMVIAALLHDIVEDCPEWTVERVEREFGKRVAALVGALTMPEGDFSSRDERLHVYHGQLLSGKEAEVTDRLKLKLADRLHNLDSASSLSHDAQRRIIEETERVYLPVAERKGILAHELKAALAERRAGLSSGSGGE